MINIHRHILKYLCLCLLFISTIKASAQDVVFNNLLSAPQYLNPAMAGTFGRYHASLAMRSQFSSSANIYNTLYADFDTYIAPWKSSIGVYVMNDRSSESIFQTTSIGLAYTYAFNVAENIVLRPAIQGVFYLSQQNPASLIFPDQTGTGGTAFFPYEESSKQRIDFSAGLLLQHPFFEAGLAMQHIGSTKTDSLLVYGDYHSKITIHGQAFFAISGKAQLLPLNEWASFNNIVLVPQVKYIHQSDFNYVIAGATMRVGALFAGISLKTPLQNQTFLSALSIGLESSSLKMGYSFDFITAGSQLRGWDSGSHELFLHYSFGQTEERRMNNSRRRSKQPLNPICNCPY